METFAFSRNSLHRVAVHILARSRIEAAGRFSLRVARDGFGTPEIPPDGRRLRVSGSHLLVESDAPGAASSRAIPINGTSLSRLADFAGVDLTRPIDVGHDTPPVGSVDAPIEIDAASAGEVNEWFGLVAAILDRVLIELPGTAIPTLPRLWPEHFDVAVEAQASSSVRVNLGGSPGDGFSNEPYLYVGPWTSDRPGDAGYWNALFGAARGRSELAAISTDVVAAGAAFLIDGYRRLAGAGA